MPLNVRRFNSSIFLVLFTLVSFAGAQSQQAVSQPSPIPAATIPIKTAGDIMRERISKAKAFIAVRNYNAAIYELEMIRRETSDQSVHAVTNTLLMNSYLEQGNYKKAQDFLSEFYKHFKANNANGTMNYSAVAAQVVKGARNQIERYRSLGLSVSDRNLPIEAVNDIEKMREMLELVIKQSHEVSLDKAKANVAMPLLEEATAARTSLARDDYDAKRWREEGIDAREQLTSSRSVVINATDGTTVPNASPNTAPQTNQPQTTPAVNTAANFTAGNPKPVDPPQLTPPQQNLPVQETIKKPSDTQIASSKPTDVPVVKLPEVKASDDRPARVVNDPPKENTTENQAAAPPKPAGPVEVGSLLDYATTKTTPLYPSAARSLRATGVVKVELVVDEKGQVAEVKGANGHQLLQTAAKDAIRKWKFRPVMRDGQPVKASGFVNFNFTL